MFWRVVAVVVALSASAHANRLTDFTTAISKRDTAAVRELVTLPLRVRNVAFIGEACVKFHGARVKVDAAELDALVNCLADMGVKPLTGPDDRWINAVYGPGLPLVISPVFFDKVTTLMGYVKPDGDNMYEIEPATLVSHLKNFKRVIVPSKTLKRELDASSIDRVIAHVSVCIDRGGTLDVAPWTNGDGYESYETDVRKAARAWKGTPFKLGGESIIGCAVLTVGYPAARFDLPLQLPAPHQPSSPQNVVPSALEKLRLRGHEPVEPHYLTKLAIALSDKGKVYASFKLCIDETGAVTDVSMLSSSGFPEYDAKIERTMKTWDYKPYYMAGEATEVCSSVTFAY